MGYMVFYFKSENMDLEKENSITQVVWDGDNTIWGWLEYAVPAYEAMAAEIGRISGRSIDEVEAAMKAFYTSVGTIEHEGLIQGLERSGFFSHMPKFNRDEIILAAQRAFHKARHEHLRVYEGVAKVMEEIRNRGIIQILLTDAPGVQAEARLRRSGLADNFSDIFAMPTAEIEGIPVRLKKSRPSTSPLIHVLPKEKPHVDLEEITGLERAMIAERVAIIGDNLKKDMVLAGMYNCLGVHAAYGVSDADLVRRILKFAPERVAGRNMQVGSGEDVNSGRIVTANNPLEIIDLLFCCVR